MDQNKEGPGLAQLLKACTTWEWRDDGEFNRNNNLRRKPFYDDDMKWLVTYVMSC
jgi:hypothetical protein